MKFGFVMVCIGLFCTSLKAQLSYFPPIFGNEWDTISPSSLSWCDDRIDSLYSFLEERDTKGFIVLKDGKIVLEKYFGTFTIDSSWYWASAGKIVTSFLTGLAQEQGFLNINDKTSDYLGEGWTIAPSDKEDLIKVKNHLTLTTGLNYDVPDLDCMEPSCLSYLQDAGTNWYYYNATYLLLQSIIANATGVSFQNYYSNKLGLSTGMFGLWNDGILYSKPRAMARFGSLILNKGIWNNDTIMSDTSYFNQMINTSQDFNLSYGYLFWLNGKESFMMPTTNFTFDGEVLPEGADDMIMGLGKNDQKLYIIPSQNMVVVRMGNPGSPFAAALSQFDNLLWQKINELNCSVSTVEDRKNTDDVNLYPNPVENKLFLNVTNKHYDFYIYNLLGEKYDLFFDASTSAIDVEKLPKGIYYLKMNNTKSNLSTIKKFIKN
jgi:CubicO group peptidase (beta-lactamase class C family)